MSLLDPSRGFQTSPPRATSDDDQPVLGMLRGSRGHIARSKPHILMLPMPVESSEQVHAMEMKKVYIGWQVGLQIYRFTWETKIFIRDTVDGWNPAPVEVGSLSPLFIGFHTSQVVFQISAINSRIDPNNEWNDSRSTEVLEVNITGCKVDPGDSRDVFNKCRPFWRKIVSSSNVILGETRGKPFCCGIFRI